MEVCIQVKYKYITIKNIKTERVPHEKE